MSVASQQRAGDARDDRDARDGSAGDTGLSRETAFEVLSCTRRRYVLHHLLADDGRATLRELTRRVAAWENDTTPDDITSQQRMRAYTALRQSHLPKMEREGVVSFDPASGDVELTDDAEALEVYLEVMPGDEIAWSDYYLGLGALGVALTAAVWVDAFPFTLVPAAAWVGVVSLAVVASGVVHALRSRHAALGAHGEPP